jgi:hypothetical protein
MLVKLTILRPTERVQKKLETLLRQFGPLGARNYDWQSEDLEEHTGWISAEHVVSIDVPRKTIPKVHSIITLFGLGELFAKELPDEFAELVNNAREM